MRGGRSWGGVLLAVAAVCVFAFFGLLTLLLIGGFNTGGRGLVFGMVLGTLPVPVYAALALWLDRYEKEPVWMLAGAFFWGATVAVFLSFVLNSISGAVVASVAGAAAGDFFMSVISAPVVEESSKGFALLVLFLWKRDEFDGVVDGVVYAAMVGLGFAMVENFSYYGAALVQGGIEGGVATFVVRGVLTPFNHPLFTAMFGIGLGLARVSGRRWVKVSAPVVGFFLAMLLHALWNGLSYVTPGLLGLAIVISLLLFPTMAGVLVAVSLSLGREGRVVREFLRPELEAGEISASEYRTLGSVSGRLASTMRAFFSGPGRWRARRRFNQAASELAFHRDRISRGLTSGGDRERDEGYRAELLRLGGRL
ncbi:PrsW family intramembrane metalloprotease [Rubrobacter indicoceani]|uniref:PrsW family intramembrane metalloprotease n=1 Tax=Rubrobacter indicoceani TaxID=2051957 RepID=UPI000E5BEB72|nr:PrsW family intramembrane metalloprotease [Rubrobacter indicoceani]